MTTFFTSDTHFGHRLVAEHRGFDTTEAHDVAVAERWIEDVRKDDIVWVLGDLTLSSNPEYALGLLSRLPGRKRLISGNHDAVHPMHTRAFKHYAAYNRVFEFVSPFAQAKVLGTKVALSHFPYVRDRGEARYMEWRLRDEGLPLLHGHTHGKEKLTQQVFSHSPMRWVRTEIHVGLDAWDLRPVSDQQVHELLVEAGCTT